MVLYIGQQCYTWEKYPHSWSIIYRLWSQAPMQHGYDTGTLTFPTLFSLNTYLFIRLHPILGAAYGLL